MTAFTEAEHGSYKNGCRRKRDIFFCTTDNCRPFQVNPGDALVLDSVCHPPKTAKKTVFLMARHLSYVDVVPDKL